MWLTTTYLIFFYNLLLIYIMIQRRQTLYLLGASILFLLMFKFPLIRITSDSSLIYEQYVNGVKLDGEIIYNTLPLTIYVFVLFFLSFSTIFFFKRHIIQIRLTIYTAVLAIGAFAVIWFFDKSFIGEMDINVAVQKFGYALVFPVVAFILLVLALMGIRRDDSILRSIDRLR